MSETPQLDGLADGYVPHPETAAKRYAEAGLFTGRALWQIVTDTATRLPDAPAVTGAGTDGHRTLTYAELDRAARARAAGLLSAGLRPGERVILQQHNSAAFAITLLGLLRAGAVPVMTLPAHRISEISHLAACTGAVAYVTEDGRRGYDYRNLATTLRERVPGIRHVFIDGEPGDHLPIPDADTADVALPESVDPDLPALLLVSGGTTGLPKPIPRTHDDYVLNAALSAEITQLTAEDVYLAALPAAHNFPLCCPGIFGTWTVGGHVVFTDNPSPDSAFDVIEANKVTVTALVPALAQVWTAATEWEPADVSSLRVLQVGGSKLGQADAQALDAALGPVTQQVFGMAEGLVCYTRLDDPRELVHRCQGAPMSEYDEVRIVDENGDDVPDGEEGELLVRGPYTIRGYYRAGEQAAQSFTPDGYYRSGDAVRRQETGHLAVTGRIKDTVVRAGENVAADDVEENLTAHPSIRQAAVIGIPDADLGERISALVVTSHDHPPGEPIALNDVRSFLTDRGLAAFKLPDEVHIVPSLPITAIGKVDKKTLRAELAKENA